MTADAPPPAALRAVLFDFDGTLGDSFPAITASVNHVRALHRLDPLSEGEVRRHVGRGVAQLLTETVPGGDPAADLAAFAAHHPSVLRSGTRLMPGAAEALGTLHRRGVRLGVCSNKLVAFTRQLLDWLGVAGLLEVVLGPEDVARPKPAPDMLLAALERLKIKPPEALYIGDMTLDVQTARAAGIAVWVVPTGTDSSETLARAAPDRLLRDLTEVSAVLAGKES